MTMLKRLLPIALIFLTIPFHFISAQSPGKAKGRKVVNEQKPLVTFVELGSVRCIPCQKMKPVMKAIEKNYRGRVKVVFHDVWTAEGKPYAAKYGIKLIPTQVFLDADGNEFHRHEGFYPEKEIDKMLSGRGIKKGK